MSKKNDVTVVACFSGFDPTGGAGIQADIEALASMGTHCTPFVTALTVQDTHTVLGYQTVDPQLLLEQARVLFADMDVAAIKIGMLGSVEIVNVVVEILKEHPDLPVVLDPVLAAGGGTLLSDTPMIKAIREQLLPLVTVCTPNSPEARILANQPETSELSQCASIILENGCDAVFITGSHEPTQVILNTLYGQGEPETFSWERLPAIYHGSGCTLASAITGLLAQGMDLYTAIAEAQEYTYESLRNSYCAGKGQLLPNRFYWAREEYMDIQGEVDA